jgi:hypothetical protein
MEKKTCNNCLFNYYGFMKIEGTDKWSCRLLLGIDCSDPKIWEKTLIPYDTNYGECEKKTCDMWRSDWVKTREFKPEEEALFKELNDARNALEEAQRKFYEIEHKCTHPVLQVNRWRDDTGVVHCAICGKDFGWWCPDNPDRKKPYCEYDDEKDHIHDDCIHCGAPEERK